MNLSIFADIADSLVEIGNICGSASQNRAIAQKLPSANRFLQAFDDRGSKPIVAYSAVELVRGWAQALALDGWRLERHTKQNGKDNLHDIIVQFGSFKEKLGSQARYNDCRVIVMTFFQR